MKARTQDPDENPNVASNQQPQSGGCKLDSTERIRSGKADRRSHQSARIKRAYD